MMLPSFIGIGPQRTATTWLYENLKQKVCFPNGVKETMFFDKHYSKGIAWYEKHFSHCTASTIGEIAPTYFHSPFAIKQIKQNIPDCKIICTLRDPVKRLYSLYRLMREYGMTKLPFENAIEKSPMMMESSRYTFYLKHWCENFTEKNVLVMLNDDLNNPSEYIRRICTHIGIEPFLITPDMSKPTEKEYPAKNYYRARMGQYIGDFFRSIRAYSVIEVAKRYGFKNFFFGGGTDLPQLNIETELELRRRLMPEIESLERFLCRDLSGWKQTNDRSHESLSPVDQGN